LCIFKLYFKKLSVCDRGTLSADGNEGTPCLDPQMTACERTRKGVRGAEAFFSKLWRSKERRGDVILNL